MIVVCLTLPLLLGHTIKNAFPDRLKYIPFPD